MTRRELFALVFGGAAAAVARPVTPAIAFHRDAFALVMQPLDVEVKPFRLEVTKKHIRTVIVDLDTAKLQQAVLDT